MKYLIILATSYLTSCGAAQEAATTEDPSIAAVATGSSSKEDKESQGSQGSKGDKGEKGDKGDKGDTGVATQGAAGTAGADGVDGIDGASASLVDAFDSSGVKFGQLYGVNWSSNLYYVVNSNNDRFEVDQTNGTFPYAYIVYAGANCTGEKRLLLTNGKFANVYVDGRDSSLVRMTGQNLGAFNYQSRVPSATNCQNAVGSTTNSYASGNYTGISTYPLGRIDIEN